MTNDNKNTSIFSRDFQEEISPITAACVIVDMTSKKGVTPEQLRAKYASADDATILQIVDTLSPMRYNWMDDASEGIASLLKHVPEDIHDVVLEDALKIAFKRLKVINHLRVREDIASTSEQNVFEQGQDPFPDQFDSSTNAEEKTQDAIRTLSVWISDVERHGAKPTLNKHLSRAKAKKAKNAQAPCPR